MHKEALNLDFNEIYFSGFEKSNHARCARNAHAEMGSLGEILNDGGKCAPALASEP